MIARVLERIRRDQAPLSQRMTRYPRAYAAGQLVAILALGALLLLCAGCAGPLIVFLAHPGRR